jgi:hypothetical protein
MGTAGHRLAVVHLAIARLHALAAGRRIFGVHFGGSGFDGSLDRNPATL